MKTTTKSALAEIRDHLGVSRIDPRRLYQIDDGAYTWIGDRADLTAKDARALRAINRIGCRPDLATREERELAAATDYDALCGRCSCISATHGAAGIVRWDDLPRSWQDGSALGPIKPL